MNRLLKYVLILNLVLIIFGILMIVFTFLAADYYKNEIKQQFLERSKLPEQYDSQGKKIEYPKPINPYDSIMTISTMIFWYGLPFFIVLMSFLYIIKELNFSGYFKSLLLPFSYGIVFFIFIAIQVRVLFWGGISPLFFVEFMLAIIGITFLSVVVINLVATLIGYLKNLNISK